MEQITKNVMRELEAEICRIVNKASGIADTQFQQVKAFLSKIEPEMDRQIAATLAGDKVAAYNVEYLRGTFQATLANFALDFMQKERDQMMAATLGILRGALLAITLIGS